MSHPPLSRPAWRAALVLASGLAASCGGDPKPPSTPDLPQVTLTVPEGNVVGTSIKVIASVTGCETVSALNLFDRETRLKAFSYSSSPSTLELVAQDIPFSAVGLAANLSLVAEVECSDGRKNKSQPQPATFFPVSRVVTDAAGGQVVTDFFVIDGSGPGAAFIGCGNPGTGTPTMYRVDANGRVTDEKPMPIPCTPDTVITERTGSGKRWVWTPGENAYTIDSSLTATSQTGSDFRVTALTVLPDGDAVGISTNGTVGRLRNTSTATGTRAWNYQPLGKPLGAPFVRGNTVLIVTQNFGQGNDQAQIFVHEVDAANGPTVGGEAQRQVHIRDLLGVNGAAPATALTAFSGDGNTLYLGLQLANNQSQVVACSATAPGCEGSSAQWTGDVLPSTLGLLFPYAGGTRLAAIGAQRVWFLDTANGTMRNKDRASVNANGALHVHRVGEGGSGSNTLFLLNGPARTGGSPTLPQEIVAVDQSGSGEVRELFRYQVPTNMSASVDESGRLWMRTGFNLVQTLSTSEYRRFRP